MTDPNWPFVALAFVQMLQVVALAFINHRGVVLPPTNRRRSRRSEAEADDET